jgi:hypothetical protein
VTSTLLAAQDIKWTDVVTALGTVALAIVTVAVAIVAVYIARLGPRLAQQAADAAEERQRRHEEEAEDRRFRSAALLVHDELRANLATLEVALKTGQVPEPLASQTYRDHQLVLALHLKPDDRDDVRAAYVYAWAPRVFIRTGDGTAQSVRTNVEAAKNKTERAMVVLGWVARELAGAYKDL